MIDSSTNVLYGFPVDSVAPNNPSHRPFYFAHEAITINTSYRTFLRRYRTRRGDKYKVRHDFGYLRSCSFKIKISNEETLQFYEYFLRSARAEVILPYWPAYVRISGNKIADNIYPVDTTEENITTQDYALLLKADYSGYSIRRITNVYETQIELESGPTDTFEFGDFLIPCLVGSFSQPPKLNYAVDRRSGTLLFELKEFQPLGERIIETRASNPTFSGAYDPQAFDEAFDI